jgi:hypothetical protein
MIVGAEIILSRIRFPSAFERIHILVLGYFFFFTLLSLLIPILRTISAASTRHDVMTPYYPTVFLYTRSSETTTALNTFYSLDLIAHVLGRYHCNLERSVLSTLMVMHSKAFCITTHMYRPEAHTII